MGTLVIVSALVGVITVVVAGGVAGWLQFGRRGNELRGPAAPMRHGGTVVASGHLVGVAHAALVRPGRHRAPARQRSGTSGP